MPPIVFRYRLMISSTVAGFWARERFTVTVAAVKVIAAIATIRKTLRMMISLEKQIALLLKPVARAVRRLNYYYGPEFKIVFVTASDVLMTCVKIGFGPSGSSIPSDT